MFAPLLAFALFQSSPSWASLKSSYNYSAPAELPTFTPMATPAGASGSWFRFDYPGAPGDTVHAVFAEPSGAGKFPLVLLLHGLGGSKDDMTKSFGPSLLVHGIAFAAIDAPGHGERQTAADKAVFQQMFMALGAAKGDIIKGIEATDKDGKMMRFTARAVTKGVIDERALLDILLKRPELNSGHVDLLSVSMGSIMATILAGVDHRVTGMALLVGGDPVLPTIDHLPPQMRPVAFDASCSLFAPHCVGPEFMLSASKDTIIPRDATERLFNAFPKGSCTIAWYDSNHFLPAQAVKDAIGWIEKREDK